MAHCAIQYWLHHAERKSRRMGTIPSSIWSAPNDLIRRHSSHFAVPSQFEFTGLLQAPLDVARHFATASSRARCWFGAIAQPGPTTATHWF